MATPGDPDSVKAVLKKFCLSTSVRGVGRIFKTKSRLLMVMWTVVVLTFLVFSVYQVAEIVTGYLRFETKQDQKIKIPRTIPFPDITLCNLQPFRRQVVSDQNHMSDAEQLVVEYFKNVSRRMSEYGKTVHTATMNWDRSDAPFDAEGEDGESIDTNPNYDAYDYFSMDNGGNDDSDDTEYDSTYYDAPKGESLKRGPEIVDNHTLEGILSTTAAVYQNINQTMQESLGHQKNMIDHCTYTVQVGRRLKTEDCHIKTFRHPQYFNCFTITREKITGTILDLSMQMFLDDDIHLFYPDRYRVDRDSQLHGIKVVVHEPGSYPNVGQMGFNVPPGMAANFYLHTTKWKHQPPPYGECNENATKSRITTWDGGSFRYEKDTCQDQCIQEHINERCHCVDAWLVNARNNTRDLPYCVDVTADLGVLQTRVACMFDFRLRPPVSCSCALPCLRYEYGTTETMSEWPHESFHLPLYSMVKHKRNLTIHTLEEVLKTKETRDLQKITQSKDTLMDTDSFQRNFVSVTVQKETFEVAVVEEKPDISLAKVLSSVGGIMCFWLGITVITTMEIVELIYDLIMYCSSKKKKAPVEKAEEAPMGGDGKVEGEKV